MILFIFFITSLAFCQDDWASPLDRTDYPNMDIGHYQLIAGKGNCHKCVSLSKKSLYASKNPDCRAIPFERAPMGKKNIVSMAQAGRCYEDNPADFARFLGLHSIVCNGFNQNFFDCEESCPFSA